MTVELKQEYRKQLQIVKNDANGKSVRMKAYTDMIDIYKQIISKEPKCDIETPEQIKTKFIDGLIQKDVIWNEEKPNEVELEEISRLENIRKIAYYWVKQNHPTLNDQTDKFGQIVNSRMNLIIASRQ